jgi:hypothetical protein
MLVTVLDNAPPPRMRFANMASEVSKDGGYVYSAIGEEVVQLYLGFVGSLSETQVVFMNPFWGATAPQKELVPATTQDVKVDISTDALTRGAHATVEFNGLSPRIRVSFPVPPPPRLTIGKVSVGFRGVWPMRGRYSFSSFRTAAVELRKAWEPFGTIGQRATAVRLVQAFTAHAQENGSLKIDAVDRLSGDFITDNLVADICELCFDGVGVRMVTLKTEDMLPDQLSSAYENTQDSIVSREVPLAI